MEWPELALGFVLFLAAGAVSRLATPKFAWIAWICCIAVVGSATAEWRRPKAAPEMVADSGEVLLVSGCVVEPLSVEFDRGRFAIEIESGARASVTMRIEPGSPYPEVPFGRIVEFPARVRKPRNYGNPGAFDYVRYLARRQTFWLASMQSHAEVHSLGTACGSAFDSKVNDFRQAAMARLEKLYPPSTAGFMRALLLGDDDHLAPTTSDEFRRTGTYHAIVISGLHISLVAGSVFWILRRAFAPLWLRMILSTLTAWVYVLAAGGGSPVLRAAFGFTLALVAAGAFRRVRVLNILAAVAIGFLVWDPEQLFEPSFQLSFAAVAAIGALAVPVLDRTSAILRQASRNIDRLRPSPLIEPRVSSLQVELRLVAETIAVLFNVRRSLATAAVGGLGRIVAGCGEMILLSTVIQFALIVPSIVYFHRVPLTGVFANLIAVPLLNGAVGVGLVGLVAGSTMLSNAAAWLVSSSQAIVASFARIEPTIRVPTPPTWLAIGFVVMLALVAVTLRRRAFFVLFPAVLSILLAGSMYMYEVPGGEAGWMEMATIDVGQGDSMLILFPNGKTMLIDGGGFPVFKGRSAPQMDIGEQVVSPYLWQRGLRHIDIVAMTHAHEDHSQGLHAVVRNFQPVQVWTGAIGNSDNHRLLEEARKAGSQILQPRAGYTLRFGDATVRVLAPSQDYVPASSPKNDDSLVLEIAYGKRRFILTGDAERSVEWRLANDGALQPVDVLKVGHHGSKTSTTQELLALTKPQFAVISVGDGNLYGHPHRDVLSRLREANTQIFRTDRFGLTSFRTDGNRLVVDTNSLAWQRE